MITKSYSKTQSFRRTNQVSGWAIAFFMLAAIFCGLVASLGNLLIAFFLASLFAAIFLLASPTVLLWGVVIGGLVVAGLAELYFPALRQARWGVALAAIGLGGASILLSFWSRRKDAVPATWTSTGTWCVLFFLISLAASILNQGISFDAIVGLKNYFQTWGILIALAMLPLAAGYADKFISFLLWLGLIQLPFVLHQHFVLVPQRMTALNEARGMVAQDILVGTFSGSMSGGGAGPAMAVLLLIALVLAIAYWRAGCISLRKLILFSAILLPPIAIGEHKIALVLLPVGFFLVFEDRVRRDPVRAVGLASLSALLLAAMFLVFTLLPSASSSKKKTVDEYWEEMWSYNLGNKGYGNAALNRSTVYPFWARYHQSAGGSAINTLIGYGPGASKDSRGSLAEHSLATERFPGYFIGLTGISGLLWDVGILGTGAAFAVILSAFLATRRLTRQAIANSRRWAHLKTTEAGIAMVGLSFLHNNMFLYEIGFQTLCMILLGYSIFVQRELRKAAKP